MPPAFPPGEFLSNKCLYSHWVTLGAIEILSSFSLGWLSTVLAGQYIYIYIYTGRRNKIEEYIHHILEIYPVFSPVRTRSGLLPYRALPEPTRMTSHPDTSTVERSHHHHHHQDTTTMPFPHASPPSAPQLLNEKHNHNSGAGPIDIDDASHASPSLDPPSPNPTGPGEPRMTRAKWLACLALGLGYTTTFQQIACTATIIKHIDDELGMYWSLLLLVLLLVFTSSVVAG